MTHHVSQAAFVPHDIDEAVVGSSTGPLSGLTVAVKDMFDIAGSRTSGGSPAWRDAHPPAGEHAGAVRSLLDAGATIIGKTVCDEFFYSITGSNAHFGTPINPRSPDRIPGGSSSGSASATASGACDLAIGSDTGGSVRIPAAHCGIYGIRTTKDRFDFTGAMTMAPSFDAGGWFASSAGVLRQAGPVLLRGPGQLAQVRAVLVLDEVREAATDPVTRVVTDALRATSSLMPAASRANLAGAHLDDWREAMRVVQAHEVWETFGEFVTSRQPTLGPGIRERMLLASGISDHDAAEARSVLREATHRMESLTPVGTVIALPTTPDLAPLLDSTAQELESYRVNAMRLVCMASISGLPQVSLPLGMLNGAPVSLSLIGWRGGDEALLDLAVALSPLAGSIIHTTA